MIHYTQSLVKCNHCIAGKDNNTFIIRKSTSGDKDHVKLNPSLIQKRKEREIYLELLAIVAEQDLE
jgi:hypothetical protein